MVAKITDLETGEEYSISRQVTTIGRASNDGTLYNTINLPSLNSADGKTHEHKLRGVSRDQHITLLREGEDSWRLRCRYDRVAYVNNELVDGGAMLEDGAEIQMGVHKYKLRFSSEG